MRSYVLCLMLIAALATASACSSRSDNIPESDDLLPEWQQQSLEGRRGDSEPAEAVNPLPQSLQQTVTRLRADLEAKGYAVAQGYAHLFTIDDCKYLIESLGNCLGNNPAAPYIFTSVPLWPDEFADENLREAFGPLPKDTWATFRLDEREAIVILAHLPPPARYFGRLTYVASREGRIDPADPVFRSVTDPFLRDLLFMPSPTPSRSLIFGTIGNSDNHVTIAKASGAAFEQDRYFITTADAVMARAVTDALLRAGVPNRNQVFIDPVSTELVRVGLGAEADDLTIWFRYARPDDEQAGERWRQQLPLTVLRVRDTDEKRATQPYPTPAYDPRTARSELGLADDLAGLRQAVRQHWQQPDAPEQPFQSLELTVDLIGQHCIERPMNCLGDIQDSDWRISRPANIDAGEVLAVVGTLGTATGNATYSSIALNRTSVLTGVGNVFDEQMATTAAGFADTVDNTDLFFVYYFARDCTGLAHCFQVTEELIPQGELLTFVERNYIVPGTARGADPKQRLNSTVIVLDGAKRPSSRP